MKDMDKAVARLEKAISGKEKILVYGDYDVDGTTAVALVYSFIRKLTPLVDFYIPDRYDEGYGVSRKGLDWASANDVKLVITLDCGIKAIDKVAYAADKGIDMIICDHHLPEEEIPAAAAVLDPKREDCNYPSMICPAAVSGSSWCRPIQCTTTLISRHFSRCWTCWSSALHRTL